MPEKYFLFLGDVMKRKNVDLIIEAGNKLKQNGQLADHQFIIAGRIKDEGLLKKVKALGLSQEIKFLGYVADEDRPALYRLAQAFVLPSFYEGFGFPVLEAAASKCLVICSQTTSLPELMDDSAIYIDPQNVDSLAGALKQAITNRQQFETRINFAFEKAKTFSWSKTAEQLTRKKF